MSQNTRVFVFSVRARISDGEKYNNINARIFGLSRNDVLDFLRKEFPTAVEIVLTSVGEQEVNAITHGLIDKIYKIEDQRRNGTNEDKRSVKPSSFYNIFDKDKRSLWR